MPRFDYGCQCGWTTYVVTTVSGWEDEVRVCPQCGGSPERLLSLPENLTLPTMLDSKNMTPLVAKAAARNKVRIEQGVASGRIREYQGGKLKEFEPSIPKRVY